MMDEFADRVRGAWTSFKTRVRANWSPLGEHARVYSISILALIALAGMTIWIAGDASEAYNSEKNVTRGDAMLSGNFVSINGSVVARVALDIEHAGNPVDGFLSSLATTSVPAVSVETGATKWDGFALDSFVDNIAGMAPGSTTMAQATQTAASGFADLVENFPSVQLTHGAMTTTAYTDIHGGIHTVTEVLPRSSSSSESSFSVDPDGTTTWSTSTSATTTPASTTAATTSTTSTEDERATSVGTTSSAPSVPGPAITSPGDAFSSAGSPPLGSRNPFSRLVALVRSLWSSEDASEETEETENRGASADTSADSNLELAMKCVHRRPLFFLQYPPALLKIKLGEAEAKADAEKAAAEEAAAQKEPAGEKEGSRDDAGKQIMVLDDDQPGTMQAVIKDDGAASTTPPDSEPGSHSASGQLLDELESPSLAKLTIPPPSMELVLAVTGGRPMPGTEANGQAEADVPSQGKDAPSQPVELADADGTPGTGNATAEFWKAERDRVAHITVLCIWLYTAAVIALILAVAKVRSDGERSTAAAEGRRAAAEDEAALWERRCFWLRDRLGDIRDVLRDVEVLRELLARQAAEREEYFRAYPYDYDDGYIDGYSDALGIPVEEVVVRWEEED